MIPRESVLVISRVLNGKSFRDTIYSLRIPKSRLKLVRKISFETIKRRNEIEYRLRYVGVRRGLYSKAAELTARFLGIIERASKEVELAYRLELKEISSGILYESLRYRHPIRLVRLFKRLLGEEAYELMEANNRASRIRFRINRLKASEEILEELGVEYYEDEEFEGIYYTRDSRIFESEARKSRKIIVQDKSSQAVLRLFGEGDILDACAAPGTKTQGLCEISKRVIAMDMSAKRIKRMKSLLEAYNARPEIILADAMKAHALFSKKFDYALVDAPCSNLGSIRDSPEIKRLLKKEKLRVLPKVQRAILESVAKISKRVIYSTCTVTREENEEVVKSVAERLGLSVETPFKNRPGMPLGSRFRPHRDDTHGFFVAILSRSSLVSARTSLLYLPSSDPDRYVRPYS